MNEELAQETYNGFAEVEIKEEKELLCTGRLLRKASYIDKRSVERKLSDEKELRIYGAKEILTGSEIERLQEKTGLPLVSNGYACFEGEVANLRTSYLQEVIIDRAHNCIYLTTLNSRYVFLVREWAGQRA